MSTTVTDRQDVVGAAGIDAHDRPRSWWPLVVLVAVVTLVWIAAFAVRVQAHQANVDDFFYAKVSRDLLHSGNPWSAVLHTGQTSPLVPVLSMPGVAVGGLYGAMAVELPLLLVLVVGAYLLVRTWLSDRAALVAGLVLGLNGGVLGYSMMLNFALAATAATVWCFLCWVRSDHLQRMGWSIGFGVAFSALVLSRTVAVVYAVPLVLVVAVDLVVAVVRRRARPGAPLLAAVLVTLVLAGPWWAVSGSTAWHYLTNAGYQPSSGYTSQGASLTPSTIYHRASQEVSVVGEAESLLLGLAMVASAVVLIVRRRTVGLQQLWAVVAWAVLTFLVLASSSNEGTAFGLPVMAMLALTCIVVLGRAGLPGIRWVTVGVLALIAVGAGAELTSSTNSWIPGPPYRTQVIDGGGTRRTNTDLLSAELGHTIGSSPAVMILSQPLANANSLSWNLPADADVLLVSGPHGTQDAIDGLARARYLVSGESTTISSFNPEIDQRAVEAAARREGFRPVRIWTEPSGSFQVLWERDAANPAPDRFPTVTRVVKPADGSVVGGNLFVTAVASSRIGVVAVEFEVTGGAGRRAPDVRGGSVPVRLARGLADHRPGGRHVYDAHPRHRHPGHGHHQPTGHGPGGPLSGAATGYARVSSGSAWPRG